MWLCKTLALNFLFVSHQFIFFKSQVFWAWKKWRRQQDVWNWSKIKFLYVSWCQYCVMKMSISIPCFLSVFSKFHFSVIFSKQSQLVMWFAINSLKLVPVNCKYSELMPSLKKRCDVNITWLFNIAIDIIAFDEWNILAFVNNEMDDSGKKCTSSLSYCFCRSSTKCFRGTVICHVWSHISDNYILVDCFCDSWVLFSGGV